FPAREVVLSCSVGLLALLIMHLGRRNDPVDLDLLGLLRLPVDHDGENAKRQNGDQDKLRLTKNHSQNHPLTRLTPKAVKRFGFLFNLNRAKAGATRNAVHQPDPGRRLFALDSTKTQPHPALRKSPPRRSKSERSKWASSKSSR